MQYERGLLSQCCLQSAVCPSSTQLLVPILRTFPSSASLVALTATTTCGSSHPILDYASEKSKMLQGLEGKHQEMQHIKNDGTCRGPTVFYTTRLGFQTSARYVWLHTPLTRAVQIADHGELLIHPALCRRSRRLQMSPATRYGVKIAAREQTRSAAGSHGTGQLTGNRL